MGDVPFYGEEAPGTNIIEDQGPSGKTFSVSVVAPGHSLYKCRARMLVVPGETGSLGVMAGHVPLLTTLAVGLMHLVDEKGMERWFAVTGGFFEMMGDHATVLADHLIDSDAVIGDLEAAGRAKGVLLRPYEYPSDVARVDMAKALLSRKMSEIKAH
ncbi:MAG: F0F1 ATP synthase subunit epsilon [Candidatus Ozemobacteraceae bacterium]